MEQFQIGEMVDSIFYPVCRDKTIKQAEQSKLIYSKAYPKQEWVVIDTKEKLESKFEEAF